MTYTIDELFEVKEKTPRNNGKKRNYDVRVTLNRSKTTGRICVRFGFLNNAVKAFEGKKYVQVSRIDRLPNCIYFRLFDEKVPGAYKLSSNRSLSIAITPTEETDKIYRARWIGKEFELKLSEKHGLWYIGQEQSYD